MGYLSFAVVIFVASFTLFGTKLNEASAEPILASRNDNVAVELGLEKRGDPVLLTTDPPTFTEHEDHQCTSTKGRNSLTGTAAACAKDPKCPGYEDRGKGKLTKRCKGELKFGDGTTSDTTGMKGMKKQEENAKTKIKVHIKNHCADGLKNQDEEDVDCGGTVCTACALKNSCGKQPSCDKNGAAPNCVSEVCKCGSADSCMVASADTAPVCSSGTCACSASEAACTGSKKCVGGKCVDAACGKAAAACPTDEVCDSDVCKCQDTNSVKGPTCAGNPGGEVCDKTASAPTCKCTADQDSCSGNLLAPNCNAEAPQDADPTKKGKCECAPGEGACPDGTLCVDKKCMCGDIPVCKDPKAPTCDFANSQCMCGTGPGCTDMTNADTCDVTNNKCVCGTTGDACDLESDKPICKDGACAAKE